MAASVDLGKRDRVYSARLHLLRFFALADPELKRAHIRFLRLCQRAAHPNVLDERGVPRTSVALVLRCDHCIVPTMTATVLVVDDDMDVRCTVAEILREEGFRVREARNGVEALRKVADERPDLMLLDLMMPEMSGWQVLQTLRSTQRYRTLPVVVLSAVPQVRATTDGYSDYIEKPISFARLLRLVESIRAHVSDPPPS
jgi:CheY-like chemotaxis protein